jgi:hypothetical protein
LAAESCTLILLFKNQPPRLFERETGGKLDPTFSTHQNSIEIIFYTLLQVPCFCKCDEKQDSHSVAVSHIATNCNQQINHFLVVLQIVRGGMSTREMPESVGKNQTRFSSLLTCFLFVDAGLNKPVWFFHTMKNSNQRNKPIFVSKLCQEIDTEPFF